MQKNRLWGYILVVIVVSSCNPVYYRPNTQQIPLFKEKGEGRASIASNMEDQIELQGAYAVSNNIGIVANGLYAKYNLDNGTDMVKGKLIEAGAGYFMPVKYNFVFEVYGLAGIGHVHNRFGETITPIFDRTIESDLFRLSVLPVIGYRIPNFSVALSTRIALLNYFNYKGGYIYDSELQTYYLHNNKSNILLEPALTIRGGWHAIQLQAQLVGCVNLSNSNFHQENTGGSLGIIFLLNNKSKIDK